MVSSGNSHAQRAFGLVELLVVVAIIAIMAAIILPRYLGGTTLSGQKLQSPRVAAHSVECREYLAQVRQAIQMAKMGEDQESANPPSIESLKLPSDITHCPVGHESYVYNQQTGEVHCPHPGHESY